MRKRNGRKYSYVILLALSFLAAGSIWGTGMSDLIIRDGGLRDGVYASVRDKAQETAHFRENENIGARPSKEKPVGKAEAERPSEMGRPSDGWAEAKGQPAAGPVMTKADTAYFDDALFLGDSRTVGLHEYGNLGGAEVIADSGMSVYKISKKEFKLSTGEKGTLEELLKARQFGKIYIMLGINELGYDYEATVSRYRALLDNIQELQPDAILYLEANLYITEGKSADSPIYNNENIRRFNEAVAGMADNETRFYLDVNELFGNENGSLSEEYTVDNAHVLGIYYADWGDWILEHAVEQ